MLATQCCRISAGISAYLSNRACCKSPKPCAHYPSYWVQDPIRPKCVLQSGKFTGWSILDTLLLEKGCDCPGTVWNRLVTDGYRRSSMKPCCLQPSSTLSEVGTGMIASDSFPLEIWHLLGESFYPVLSCCWATEGQKVACTELLWRLTSCTSCTHGNAAQYKDILNMYSCHFQSNNPIKHIWCDFGPAVSRMDTPSGI